ncbi:hypothetical protein VNO77_44260 [Canavalia gladiata]|uniref:Uncharacterized protein n=1 Tax=Canavalia gladiata TaxID=3824 RepID=A0AAN9JXW0_CANGL
MQWLPQSVSVFSRLRRIGEHRGQPEEIVHSIEAGRTHISYIQVSYPSHSSLNRIESTNLLKPHFGHELYAHCEARRLINLYMIYAGYLNALDPE